MMMMIMIMMMMMMMTMMMMAVCPSRVDAGYTKAPIVLSKLDHPFVQAR